MTDIEAKIENGFLIVKIALQEPTRSSSGKTVVIASTHGNIRTEVKYEGKLITIGLNAYYKP